MKKYKDLVAKTIKNPNAKVIKKLKEIADKPLDLAYGNYFKEDLILQLCHLVQEIKGIREEFKELNKLLTDVALILDNK